MSETLHWLAPESALGAELVDESVAGPMPFGDEYPRSLIVFGGRRPHAGQVHHDWDEYLDEWYLHWRPYVSAIRALVEREGLVGVRADQLPSEDKYFRFADGTMISFSMRAWGDLMSAIVGKREGYCAYFCGWTAGT